MIELDLQKLTCDVVNGAGGFAFKSANRFLVGVSDLFVKLPYHSSLGVAPKIGIPAGGWIEVKQRTGFPRDDVRFNVGVTGPQKAFLKRNHDAGVPTGVLSFVQTGSGSGLILYAALHPYISCFNTEWGFRTSQHVLLGKKGEREGALLALLYQWHREWRNGL